MNKQIAAIQDQLNHDNKLQSDTLTEVNGQFFPFPPKGLIKVFRSKTFMVHVYDEQNATRLSICRTQINDKGKWESDIKWEELQEIKRQVGFGDKLAVEVYPKEKHVVNVSNMRHLWLMDVDLVVGWVNAN